MEGMKRFLNTPFLMRIFFASFGQVSKEGETPRLRLLNVALMIGIQHTDPRGSLFFLSLRSPFRYNIMGPIFLDGARAS